MRKNVLGSLAVAGALSTALFVAGSAVAQSDGFVGEGSGTATVAFIGDGNEVEVSIEWEGLAEEIPDLSGTDFEELGNMPFPHAQHIHANGQGQCPSPDLDTDGNGVIDTPEGEPAYGPVVTSLTEEGGETGPGQTLDVENFPTGGSTSYNRTIELSDNAADEVRAGNAVVVIHGLNPAIMPGDTALEPSPLDSSFPLAATAPALCGPLTEIGDGVFQADLTPSNVVAQVAEAPDGAVDAGGGSTAGTEFVWLFGLGGLALAGAAGATALAVRRHRSADQA